MKLLQLIDEIKVVSPGRVIVRIPYVTENYERDERSKVLVNQTEILTFTDLTSKFKEYERSEVIDIYMLDTSQYAHPGEEDSIVNRAVCCLPYPNTVFPSGFKIEVTSRAGFVFAVIKKFPDMSLSSIRTKLAGEFFMLEHDLDFQEALQHLFDTGI